MGKRSRHRDAKSTRVRLEELLDKGDTRGAVEAAKLLVREEPGAASGDDLLLLALLLAG